MSSIDDAIQRGDVKAIIRSGIGAMRAEAEGRYCSCDEPDLTGRMSYLCFACGLPNMARKAEIEAAMVAPHPYEVMDRVHRLLADTCCNFCSMPRSHLRHAPQATDSTPRGED